MALFIMNALQSPVLSENRNNSRNRQTKEKILLGDIFVVSDDENGTKKSYKQIYEIWRQAFVVVDDDDENFLESVTQLEIDHSHGNSHN